MGCFRTRHLTVLRGSWVHGRSFYMGGAAFLRSFLLSSSFPLLYIGGLSYRHEGVGRQGHVAFFCSLFTIM